TIDDVSTHFLEHPFGLGFSDRDQAGTKDVIREDIVRAFQQAFGARPPGGSDSLGPVESRISDGARLLGRALEQTAGGLRIFGDAQIQIPGSPKISPPFWDRDRYFAPTFTVYETPASACAGGEPRFDAQPLTIKNLGDGPLTVCGIGVDPGLAMLPVPTF